MTTATDTKGLINRWRELARVHRTMADTIDRGKEPCRKTVISHQFSAATLEACANDLEALSSSASSETPLREPEVVWHYDCPLVLRAALQATAGRPAEGVSYSHPVMRLVKRMDDVAGHKRVYECTECGARADVNFPPSASSETQEERPPSESTKDEIAKRVADKYLHRYVPHFNIDGHHEREHGRLTAMVLEAITEYADALKEQK